LLEGMGHPASQQGERTKTKVGEGKIEARGNRSGCCCDQGWAKTQRSGGKGVPKSQSVHPRRQTPHGAGKVGRWGWGGPEKIPKRHSRDGAVKCAGRELILGTWGHPTRGGVSVRNSVWRGAKRFSICFFGNSPKTKARRGGPYVRGAQQAWRKWQSPSGKSIGPKVGCGGAPPPRRVSGRRLWLGRERFGGQRSLNRTGRQGTSFAQLGFGRGRAAPTLGWSVRKGKQAGNPPRPPAGV